MDTYFEDSFFTKKNGEKIVAVFENASHRRFQTQVRGITLWHGSKNVTPYSLYCWDIELRLNYSGQLSSGVCEERYINIHIGFAQDRDKKIVMKVFAFAPFEKLQQRHIVHSLKDIEAFFYEFLRSLEEQCKLAGFIAK